MGIRSRVSLALAATGLLACAGCASKAPINLVRNGVLPEFNTTTVGKAFEGTFQKPKWTTFGTSKGTAIVEFTGTVIFSTLGSSSLGNDNIEKRCIASMRLG